MTLLLAIEASTSSLSLALFKDNSVIEKDFYFNGNGQHSIKLLPMLDELLKRADTDVNQIDTFCCSRGPGAFTSVRICLATTLGLAFPKDRKVYALNTIETMAINAKGRSETDIMPMLDARKGEVYSALYSSDLKPGEPLVKLQTAKAVNMVEQALEKSDRQILCFGSGATAYAEEITSIDPKRVIVDETIGQHPTAENLGYRIIELLENNIEPEPASPLYLRKPEAVVNLEKRIEERNS